ncbi:MAG: HD domain-containing protein [Pseudomonadales bacterium]|nr:HD domain-containing protein [Halioglobus sp.]MCP5193782.1 HD domain-containing protein [Pseudomonadales bacterium]
MQQFAQNYPQLMNQAVAVDLSQEDLSRLRSAFDFCQLLADGIYRAQGIPLLNHLVRTASIVLNQTNSVDVVITALLHAAFVVDKFDHSTRTPDLEIKRKDIRRLFGNEIEHLLLAYEKMAWYHKKALQHYLQVHASLSQEMKNLLLIRLANELEDHLDFAMAYTPPSREARRSLAYGSECVSLARALGYGVIADNLNAILTEQQAVKIPDQLRTTCSQGYQFNQPLWPMSLLRRARNALALLARKHLGRR